MIIRFNDIGSSLGTRAKGQEIRKVILGALEQGDFVKFDLTGVKVMSHSFADECFGKILLEVDLQFLKSNSTFKNANSAVSKTISFVLKSRMQDILETA
ncbi:STAS-like domain-containing protein [Marivirga tractuosa]|uniref:STAS-like domain-containing protein n=1 Tax=Marivirga tractuosa TaxID=1006 RepID=UPI0035CFF00A